jgi:hypothetical protein
MPMCRVQLLASQARAGKAGNSMTLEIFGQIVAAATATAMLWLTVNLDRFLKDK